MDRLVLQSNSTIWWMYISCQSLFLTAQICFLLVFKISHPLVLIILVCRRQTLFRLAHAFIHFFSPSPLYWFSGEALGCSWFICNASVSSKEVPQLFDQLASTTGARPSTPNRGLLCSATIAYARYFTFSAIFLSIVSLVMLRFHRTFPHASTSRVFYGFSGTGSPRFDLAFELYSSPVWIFHASTLPVSLREAMFWHCAHFVHLVLVGFVLFGIVASNFAPFS